MKGLRVLGQTILQPTACHRTQRITLLNKLATYLKAWLQQPQRNLNYISDRNPQTGGPNPLLGLIRLGRVAFQQGYRKLNLYMLIVNHFHENTNGSLRTKLWLVIFLLGHFGQHSFLLSLYNRSIWHAVTKFRYFESTEK